MRDDEKHRLMYQEPGEYVPVEDAVFWAALEAQRDRIVAAMDRAVLESMERVPPRGYTRDDEPEAFTTRYDVRASDYLEPDTIRVSPAQARCMGIPLPTPTTRLASFLLRQP